jgi:hypothetical protein
MLDGGDGSVSGFVSNLKGKVAELRLVTDLEAGYPDYKWAIAGSPTQPIWDIKGMAPEGSAAIFVQVKMGASGYTYEVMGEMDGTPENVLFAVSREIHNKIARSMWAGCLTPAFRIRSSLRGWRTISGCYRRTLA